jgi:tryptophan halogenase
MEVIQATDVLERVRGFRSLQLADGTLLVGDNHHNHHFGSDRSSAVSAILELIDGEKTVAQICEALASEITPGHAAEILKQLLTCAIQVAQAKQSDQPDSRSTSLEKHNKIKVLLLGNGRLADWLESQLTMLADVSRLDSAALLGEDNADEKTGNETSGLPLRVAGQCKNSDLVVAALEGASYQDIHSLNSLCLLTGASFLPVLLETASVLVGPTILQGDGPCVVSAGMSLMQNRPPAVDISEWIRFVEAGHTSHLEESNWNEAALLRLAMILRREIRGLTVKGMSPQLLLSVVRISNGGELTRHSILGTAHCPICASSLRSAQVPPTKKAQAEEAHVQVQINDLMWLESERTARPSANATCRSVGVIGGGTAGYLTALALQKTHPELKVTLIESSTVPIIGVGEATTPLMPAFLHGLLGFSIHEFFKEVQPTFKLGIKFLWGAPDDHFDYPFGDFALLEPHAYEDKIVDHSLYSQLMAGDRFPLAEVEKNGRCISFLRAHTAYHLDNVRFVNYLSKKARERNIDYVDALIRDVETCQAADGVEEVAAVHLADGRRLTFDLYVDCTGFRSLLLGKALQTRYISYDKSLFNDQAVVADVPHGGRLKPYTLAETMNSGWCWAIPQVEADHRGYVHSSAFCTIDQAVAEMRTKNPTMGDYRVVRFRSGRHEEFWRGNVVAMGNAYAFVEPLESTALHMVLTQIRLFLDALPVQRYERGIQRCLSRRVADHWDYIRWFLAIHYRFNRRLNTPYWQACREHTDMSTLEELFQHYQERGPLSYYRGGSRVFGAHDAIWGPQGIDMVLMGQKVPSRAPLPTIDESTWRKRVRIQRGIVSRCLREEEALRVLGSDPAILSSFANEAVYTRRFN